MVLEKQHWYLTEHRVVGSQVAKDWHSDMSQTAAHLSVVRDTLCSSLTRVSRPPLPMTFPSRLSRC